MKAIINVIDTRTATERFNDHCRGNEDRPATKETFDLFIASLTEDMERSETRRINNRRLYDEKNK